RGRGGGPGPGARRARGRAPPRARARPARPAPRSGGSVRSRSGSSRRLPRRAMRAASAAAPQQPELDLLVVRRRATQRLLGIGFSGACEARAHTRAELEEGPLLGLERRAEARALLAHVLECGLPRLARASPWDPAPQREARQVVAGASERERHVLVETGERGVPGGGR